MASVKTPAPRTVRGRRRGGTQPSPLSLDDVMDAAMAITERGGLDSLTVKAVADELGVTSPAVYHYVDGKQALVERVCERVTRQVDLTVDPALAWDDQIVSIIVGMHHAFALHPGVGAKALSITGPAPAAKRIAATLRDIVLAAGFPTSDGDELVAALHLLFSGWLVGKVPESSPPTEMTPALLERTTRRLLAGYTTVRGASSAG